jgi:hypothetical protein
MSKITQYVVQVRRPVTRPVLFLSRLKEAAKGMDGEIAIVKLPRTPVLDSSANTITSNVFNVLNLSASNQSTKLR